MGLKIAVRLQGKRIGAVPATALFLVLVGFGTPEAQAVVGRAEEFDRFTREELEEFQEKLVEEAEKPPEQKKEEQEKAMKAQLLIEGKKQALKGARPEETTALQKELKRLEEELLQFPKKDRFRFGGDFDKTYDTNVDRKVIRQEEGDTTFRLIPFVSFDFGGRKTDLRTEFRGGRQYNVKKPEKDLYTLEGRFRFGRKILKKTTLSLNDRLNRESTRTIEIDEKRIRWDNAHRAALNYQFSPKFSINLEADYTRRDWPHEDFDQDSDYQFTLDPSFFFQATPKTRFSLGYRWGFSRIRTKLSDTTSHEVRVGYFGKITGKSSATLDIAYNHQDPHSADATASDQVRSSVGYIWQATPKTSLRALYSHSLQNSTSDKVASGELEQTNSHFIADTLSLSLRYRVNRRLSTEISFDGAHSRSKTSVGRDPKTETRQFTFPFQAAVDFVLAQWIRLRFTYTYRHRIGDEKGDEHRAHTWFFGSNVSF